MTARISRKSRNASTADLLPLPAPAPVGRFAPTPSGPLHYGSIVAALGSWLDVRHRGGRWLLRIDDLDQPRVRPGAEARILAALEQLGLDPDGPILHQVTRTAAYGAALLMLQDADLLYACRCTRREVAGRPYPGTCRERGLADGPGRSLRLRVPPGVTRFDDGILGPRAVDVGRETGDFIVRRADGMAAFHLAAAVDDAGQRVTRVVRGADLLPAAAAQCCVYDALGLPRPAYAHLPMAVDAAGRKISKRLGAEDALLATRPAQLLVAVLQFLGQQPPPSLARSAVREVLEWAVAHWQPGSVPREPRLPPVLPP